MTRGFALKVVIAHAIGAAMIGGLAAACSGGSSNDGPPAEASCPDLSNVNCPSPPPSYETEVQPILANRCYACHGPGGIETASINLSTYDDVRNLQEDIVSQVSSCKMPLADAGPMPVAERTTLYEWLQCSSPNN
jgi:uncharacterized membrane protein